ncbi:hypothetical protein [uncultured Metabacillus sp.]|uniref:hypothetical protein n=1 Tax=uncultured Metabacillus sp. TaxID=2860135 RepID=UPI00260B7BDF|nr:hypothetical protein [uncultured Metabacillus sp.]
MKNQNEATLNGGTFGSKANFLLVMIMILGVFVAILNETLLNVALPIAFNHRFRGDSVWIQQFR